MTRLIVSKFTLVCWSIGWLGFNGPLRQYFRRKREMIDERKNVQTNPTRTYCKRNTEKKLLVKLTYTLSICLQKRIFLQIKYVSISQFDYLCLSVIRTLSYYYPN